MIYKTVRVFATLFALLCGSAHAALAGDPSSLTLIATDFTAINDAAAGARPVPDCTPQAAGVRYDVGSAAYPSFNQVPWDQLQPDDVVCVPYRAQPYRSKIYFITRGAPGHPIRLVGLRGPNGERPVIDGDQATTPPMITPIASDAYLQDYGLISLHYHFLKPSGAPWGWHPGHITITGLQIQHARGQYQYFDAAGNARSYANFSSGIYMNPGDDVVIEDCEITDNGLGIFANSHDGVFGPAELTTQNLTIRGNYIHGNGDATTLSIHNVYIEGHGCNFIGNYLEHEAGKVGTNYKSRCSHERFYANYVYGGYQGLLMLIDPQSGWNALGTAPDYEPTVVAGNVLENPFAAGTVSGGMVHFGGDSYTLPTHYRRTLLMLHNTIVEYSHNSRVSVLLPVDSTGTGLLMDQWLANNLIMNMWDQQGTAAAEFALAANDGNAFLTTNWIGSDVVQKGQYNVMKGQVTGWASSLRGIDPMLLGAGLADLRPAPGSPLIDAATAYAALPANSKAAQVNDYALYEFVGTPSAPWYRKRAVQGSAADIGAYEAPSSGANQPPVAANDSYATPFNTTLTVAAPGALANDSDPDNNTITAVLNAGPTHGALSLNVNGGFTYNPTAGYSGPDSFSYFANDGTVNSASAATVSITVGAVVPPPPPPPPPPPTPEVTIPGLNIPPSCGLDAFPPIVNLGLGEGPAFVPDMVAILSNTVGQALTFLEQDICGTVTLGGFKGGKLAFIPLAFQNGDARANGIYPVGNGQYQVVRNFQSLALAPALVHPNQLIAPLPGIAVNQWDNGVMIATFNGVGYVVQAGVPVQLDAPTGIAQLLLGSDGLFHFIDSVGHNQVLYPAFADLVRLRGFLQSQDPGVMLNIELDGTATVVLNGRHLTLVPDLTLSNIPAERAGQTWWQESSTRFWVLNMLSSGTAQGVTVKP